MITISYIHNYSINSGIICMLKTQPEVSKTVSPRWQKVWISQFLGEEKVTVPIFGCSISELKIVSVPAA